MTPQNPKFTHRDIEQFLFFGVYPQVVVYPFYGSCVSPLQSMGFTISLAPVADTMDAVDKLVNCVVKVKESSISKDELREFILSSGVVVVDMISVAVVEKYGAWYTYFQKEIGEYVSTTYSKFQWEIATSIGISTIMPPPLSMEQRLWIAFASMTHKNGERKFTIDIVESLKPWLDIELYRAQQKSEGGKRKNVNYEEARTRMISGTFGVSESDKKVFRELKKSDDEGNEQSSQDLDIIV